MLNDVGAPVVVAHHDRLTVTCGVEGVSGLGEFLAQLHIVVDLAVKRQGVTFGVFCRPPAQWLVGVLDVDDRQAVKAENSVIVVPCSRSVRAAVIHAGKRATDRVGKHWGIAAGSQQCNKTAHRCETSPIYKVRRLEPCGTVMTHSTIGFSTANS